MKNFDWIIVGGGVAGISIAEILTREGYSVALIEKNKKLASVATKEFHEWVHTGSLYTLVKDDMKTLKYILGSLDDILEFYSSFPNMNLSPSEKGLKINENKNTWFNQNYINFKYRLGSRKFILPWIYSVARSVSLIEGIRNHDWLRKRAGILESVTSEYYIPILKNFLKVLLSNKKFHEIKSTDFTTNSRNLLRDLIGVSAGRGLEIFTDNELLEIKNNQDEVEVICKNIKIKGEKMVICTGGNIEKFTNIKVRKSFAPIAVVKNVPPSAKSFVELDYYAKKCINIITKGSSFGMIGGISLSKREEVENYFEYMIDEHKKLNPRIEILNKYVGVKNEIISKKEDRNYLFHINKSNIHNNVWSVIPGKFTLAFSLAPEFYRIIYKKNPRKFFKIDNITEKFNNLIDETVWEEQQKKVS